MKPLARADYPQHEIDAVILDMVKKWNSGDPAIRQCFPEVKDPSAARAAIRSKVQHETSRGTIWLNDLYQVEARQDGPIVHLSIRRLDRQPCRDWRDFQDIKNQLVGPECEGLELYPAESRIVDTANQFHLWCLAKPGEKIPCGFDGGRIISNGTIGKSKQRPREEI